MYDAQYLQGVGNPLNHLHVWRSSASGSTPELLCLFLHIIMVPIRPPSPSPSDNTARTARKAADAITAWKNMSRHLYEQAAFRAHLEATPWPTVLCYDATAIGGSPPLSPDGDFGPAIKLIQTVARLLVNEAVRLAYIIPLSLVYRRSFEASNQFSVRHPDKRLPGNDHVLEFVTKRFPSVVFRETVRESWGSVNKADCEGADRNEIFISKDLVLAYLDTQAGRQPCVVTEQQYAKVKRFVEFILIATILHETGHCLIKYSFGPHFVTPYFPALLSLDKRGLQRQGEIGQEVEMGLLGCIAVLEWTDPTPYSNPTNRLWYVDKLLGWVKLKEAQPVWYVLTDAQINHVIEMVHHGYIDQIPFDGQDEIGDTFGMAIRAKFAKGVMEEHEDEAPSSSDSSDCEDFPEFVLNPKAFRFVPRGDRRIC